jgi:hypothetical protein
LWRTCGIIAYSNSLMFISYIFILLSNLGGRRQWFWL